MIVINDVIFVRGSILPPAQSSSGAQLTPNRGYVILWQVKPASEMADLAERLQVSLPINRPVNRGEREEEQYRCPRRF